MYIHIALAVLAAILAFSIGRWSGRKAEARERGWSRERGNAEMVERIRAPQPPPRAPAQNGIEDVIAALRMGQKINAIKIYRDMSGVGLKEAKDYVEALADQLGL